MPRHRRRGRVPALPARVAVPRQKPAASLRLVGVIRRPARKMGTVKAPAAQTTALEVARVHRRLTRRRQVGPRLPYRAPASPLPVVAPTPAIGAALPPLIPRRPVAEPQEEGSVRPRIGHGQEPAPRRRLAENQVPKRMGAVNPPVAARPPARLIAGRVKHPQPDRGMTERRTAAGAMAVPVVMEGGRATPRVAPKRAAPLVAPEAPVVAEVAEPPGRVAGVQPPAPGRDEGRPEVPPPAPALHTARTPLGLLIRPGPIRVTVTVERRPAR